MMLHSNPVPLNDVLYEFSLAKDMPDAELLEQFVRRYPAYAGPLTDLAVGIVLDSTRDDDDEAENAAPELSPAVSRAMSRFQNRLFEVQQKAAAAAFRAEAAAASAVNPFARLGRQEYRALAERLHSNTVFVGMLRDRQIDPGTMTTGFKKRVADEVQVPVELVIAHLSGQSEVGTGQFYKAEEKPQGGPKLSFEEAVRQSGLTEEQQSYLLSL
ncbi:MAG: hypothetical protein ABSG41_27500 [Bryobacteraceae bacterium]|jgi:hypothetical protein